MSYTPKRVSNHAWQHGQGTYLPAKLTTAHSSAPPPALHKLESILINDRPRWLHSFTLLLCSITHFNICLCCCVMRMRSAAICFARGMHCTIDCIAA